MRNFLYTGLALAAFSYSPAAIAQSNCDWTGTWLTNRGDMRLVQAGKNVTGDFGDKGIIKGRTDINCRLTGSFDNHLGSDDATIHIGATHITGTIDFTKRNSELTSTWKRDGDNSSNSWTGYRTFSTRPILQFSAYPIADAVALSQSMISANNMGSMGMVSTQVVTAYEAEPQVGEPLQAETPQAGEPVQAQTPSQTPSQTIRQMATSRSSTSNTLGQVYQVKKQPNLLTPPTQTGLTDRQRQIRQEAKARTTAKREAYIAREERKARSEKRKARSQTRRVTKRMREQALARRVALQAGQWEVKLDGICIVNNDWTDLITTNKKVFGMAWIKARIINKKTGKQEDVAPIGGFSRTNGDKERVWELKPKQHFKEVVSQQCYELNVSYTYDFDAVKYGYKNLDEIISNPNNRIDVMFKLTEYDMVSSHDELGTYRAATSLEASDFCGLCGDWKNLLRRTGVVPAQKGGDGTLSGFAYKGTSATAYYSIRPVGFEINY